MRVLLTFDGSNIAETALARVARWANPASTEIVLLTVLDPDHIHGTGETSLTGEFYAPADTETGHIPFAEPSQYGPVIVEQLEPLPRGVESRGQAIERQVTQWQELLAALAHRHFPGCMVEVRVELADHVPETIIQQPEAVQADCIAMATHGRSGLARVIMGSVAEHVVRHAPLPVLLVGPHARRTQETP